MQADGRFVENVQHSAQTRPDLRSQTNALRFAAGKRGGGSLQAQIFEADGDQEFQAIADLFHRATADRRSRSVSFHARTVSRARVS